MESEAWRSLEVIFGLTEHDIFYAMLYWCCNVYDDASDKRLN